MVRYESLDKALKKMTGLFVSRIRYHGRAGEMDLKIDTSIHQQYLKRLLIVSLYAWPLS